MKPKYMQALELREQGLSYTEIALRLGTKIQRIKEYLNKARHLQKKLLLHRAHNKRYYYKDLERSRKKSRDYWSKDPKRWQREKLVTVVDGKRVTLYHLHKRDRTENCELCHNLRQRLYYHHWDNSNPSKGMWLCGNCHRFVTRVDKGHVEEYLTLKERLDFLPEPPPEKVNALLKALREFVPTVTEKQGLERVNCEL